MFNSLGTIVENHSAGLLLLDFEGGGTVHLTGVARILRDDERVAGFPGAERIIVYRGNNVLPPVACEPQQHEKQVDEIKI